MVADGSWTGDKLSSLNLIELFVSKSFWHSHVKKYFSKVSDHPLLVAWLENSEDGPSDLEVWGIKKSSYNFKDLDAYLLQKSGKGKKKGKAVEKEKKGHKKAKKQVK